MNAVICRPSLGKVTSSKARRPTKALFSLVVIFTVFEICQCFVPHLAKTTTYASSIEKTASLRLQHQLTQIEPIKNNEAGEINVIGPNNTESFGTLHPRKDDMDYPSDIFPRAPSLISKNIIESTVDDMLQPSRTSMGLFGESIDERSADCTTNMGSVLATSFTSSSNVVARVATAMDDHEIANLRLSVFSNFEPESRKLFCERSCQLLSSRRRRGATCVVATVKKNSAEERKPKSRGVHRKDTAPIVGTAEISFHEFSDTKLGRSRPNDSILYVTEVAVDATQRRKGIAKLMMEAIDTLANTRKIETIYLHVDVTNLGAVNLYERAGYRKLEPDNPIFLEFTTKLNLHDGATKGRNHFLMAKDLRQPTWFSIQEEEQHVDEACTANQRMLGIDVMSTV